MGEDLANNTVLYIIVIFSSLFCVCYVIPTLLKVVNSWFVPPEPPVNMTVETAEVTTTLPTGGSTNATTTADSSDDYLISGDSEPVYCSDVKIIMGRDESKDGFNTNANTNMNMPIAHDVSSIEGDWRRESHSRDGWDGMEGSNSRDSGDGRAGATHHDANTSTNANANANANIAYHSASSDGIDDEEMGGEERPPCPHPHLIDSSDLRTPPVTAQNIAVMCVWGPRHQYLVSGTGAGAAGGAGGVGDDGGSEMDEYSNPPSPSMFPPEPPDNPAYGYGYGFSSPGRGPVPSGPGPGPGVS